MNKNFWVCVLTRIADHLLVDSSVAPATHKERKGTHVALVIVISVLVSTVIILTLVAAYKYWLKKRREQEQARFLKLFEDGDDIEDELGLGNVLWSVKRYVTFSVH